MTEADCLFCKLAEGTIPSEKVYEDDQALAFRDLHPQAPTHVLLIPKEHLDSLNDASQSDQPLLGYLLRLVPKIANQLGIAESGFRTVINTGGEGGQTVDHLHIHLLGGRPMTWPPG
ncbi:MAG: histidine triad nucleotide-binding protein [Acidobacteria bacterium]|nr:histidine triad nucleotide-binding protein [Acidobacteriota bacterium]MBI3423823.1 histidine triad nucleotide-binding protein [Acidobacteriota bacterium]